MDAEVDLYRFGVALLIGALVGFERQFSGSRAARAAPDGEAGGADAAGDASPPACAEGATSAQPSGPTASASTASASRDLDRDGLPPSPASGSRETPPQRAGEGGEAARATTPSIPGGPSPASPSSASPSSAALGMPPSGVRTFTLLALAGAITGHLSPSTPWLLPSALLAVGALIVAAYIAQTYRGRTGLTSEVASLGVFLLGAEAAAGHTTLAMACAIAIAAVLSTREALHSIADRLVREDIHAVLKFAALSVVVMPLLPAQPIRLGDVVDSIRAGARDEAHGPAEPGAKTGERDAKTGDAGERDAKTGDAKTGEAGERDAKREGAAWWEGLSLAPRTVWKMVIFISGISFAGFVLGKIIGTGRGLLVTAALGGFVSSTAVSLAYAQRSRETPELSPLLATGILLANAIMPLRLLLVVTILAPTLAARLVLPLLSIVLVAVVFTAVLHLRRGDGAPTPEVALSNPFELKPALKFGALFGVVLVVAQAAEGLFGNAGLYVVAVLTGLTDVDAISLAVANLAASGRQDLTAAATTIVLAVASNTIVKAGFVVTLGAPRLRRIAGLAFVFMLAAAGGGLAAVWLLSA